VPSAQDDEDISCLGQTSCLEKDCVPIRPGADRVRVSLKSTVPIRLTPRNKARVLGYLVPGEPVVSHATMATRRGKNWETVTSFSGIVGWVSMAQFEAIPNEWGGREPDSVEEELKRMNPNRTLRLGTWCVHGTEPDLGGHLKKILDLHQLDVALLQCIPRNKVVELSRLKVGGKYGVIVGQGASGSTVTAMVFSKSRIKMLSEKTIRLPHFQDIGAALYKVEWHGVAYVVGNLQWPSHRKRSKAELGRMAQYLVALRGRLPKGAIVAGTWPTGRFGSMMSYDSLMWVVRHIRWWGIRVVPVALSCSWYSKGKPELRQYFVWWGNVEGMSRTSYSRVWGICDILDCCPRSAEDVAACQPASVSVPDCPVVLGVPQVAKSNGAESGPRPAARVGATQSTHVGGTQSTRVRARRPREVGPGGHTR